MVCESWVAKNTLEFWSRKLLFIVEEDLFRTNVASNFLEKFFKTIWDVCTRFLNFVLSVFREDFFSVVQLISLACQVQIFKLLDQINFLANFSSKPNIV